MSSSLLYAFMLILSASYIALHIHSMDPLVCHQGSKCGTSHKYTNIQIYSTKYYKHFIKTVLYITSTHKKFIYRVK